MSEVHILCYGNYYMGDDGFGIHVYNRLKDLELPGGVSIFDAGISGFKSISLMENCKKVYIIDSISYQETEGKIHRYKFEEFVDFVNLENDYSGHSSGVNELLKILQNVEILNPFPEIIIYCAEICNIAKFSSTLSPVLYKSVDDIIIKISEEITLKANPNG